MNLFLYKICPLRTNDWLKPYYVNIVIALLCIATHAHKFYPCYDYDMTYAVSPTHIYTQMTHTRI